MHFGLVHDSFWKSNDNDFEIRTIWILGLSQIVVYVYKIRKTKKVICQRYYKKNFELMHHTQGITKLCS